MTLKKIYCEQIDAETNVCDWYECPCAGTCEAVKRFYRHIQVTDDPNNICSINGVIFYTTSSVIAPQLNKEEREQVAKRWMDGEQ
jgi:hypothetical protein